MVLNYLKCPMVHTDYGDLNAKDGFNFTSLLSTAVRLYQGTLRKHYMNPFAHMPITCMDVTRKYYACAIEYYKECVNVKALYYYYYYYYYSI